MTHATQMLKTHPGRARGERIEPLAVCIDACFDCAEACTACADACLGEDMVRDLVRCIRLNLACADACELTGKLLSRQTRPSDPIVQTQLEATLAAVRACAAECEQHGDMHEHCKVCADACRRCEEACQRLAAA